MPDKEGLPSSTNRSFGLVFSTFFIVIALLPLVKGYDIRIWAFYVSLAFGGVAMLAPKLLAPLNRVWTLFGQFLHQCMSPIALGVLYFGVVVPTGMVMRLCGKDSLRLKLDRDATTYWIERTPRGPTSESFNQQF